MTGTFYKVVLLSNKEAQTVAPAILTHWISVFRPMKHFLSDQGCELECLLEVGGGYWHPQHQAQQVLSDIIFWCINQTVLI